MQFPDDDPSFVCREPTECRVYSTVDAQVPPGKSGQPAVTVDLYSTQLYIRRSLYDMIQNETAVTRNTNIFA